MPTLQKEQQLSSVRLIDVVWSNEQHSLIIGRTTILLTAMEYRLLQPLRHGRPVPYRRLALLMYDRELDEKVRIMMDKHIDRIRGKLNGTGIYVYCVLGYGYLLLPEAPPVIDIL